MLKIKESVDLKELEKFDFKREWNWKTKEFDGEYYCSSFKVCKNRHIKPYNGTNQSRYDMMFDLIKADMVEKVEE